VASLSTGLCHSGVASAVSFGVQYGTTTDILSDKTGGQTDRQRDTSRDSTLQSVGSGKAKFGDWSSSSLIVVVSECVVVGGWWCYRCCCWWSSSRCTQRAVALYHKKTCTQCKLSEIRPTFCMHTEELIVRLLCKNSH
jgi:hypothetical protein